MPADAPPGQVAEALLRAIATAQQTRADGLGSPERKAAYDAALGQIWAGSDRPEIHDIVKRAHNIGVPADVTEDAACTLIIESWISHLAHYLGGINYESKRVVPELPQSDCVVHFDAASPTEKAKLAAIETSLAQSPPKDPSGNDAAPGGPIYLADLRARTLPEGFNVPIDTSIDMTLKKTPDGWRVLNVGLSGASKRLRSVNGTTLPAKDGKAPATHS